MAVERLAEMERRAKRVLTLAEGLAAGLHPAQCTRKRRVVVVRRLLPGVSSNARRCLFVESVGKVAESAWLRGVLNSSCLAPCLPAGSGVGSGSVGGASGGGGGAVCPRGHRVEETEAENQLGGTRRGAGRVRQQRGT